MIACCMIILATSPVSFTSYASLIKQSDGEGHFYQGMYTYDNPGLLGQAVGTPIYTYHMNWGLQGGMYNGWFSASYNFSSPINFNYNRKSVLIYN